MTQYAWWTTPESLRQAISEHGTATAAARAKGGITERTAQRWAKQFGLTAPSATPSAPTQTADARTVTEDDLPWTREQVVQRALPADDDEFVLVSCKPGVHQGLAPEGAVVDLYRAEYRFERRLDALVGINLPDGWKAPAPPPAQKHDGPIHIPLFGDPHFPMHQPELYEASLAWLAEFKPPKWVCVGDEGDWSPFKRHKTNRRTDTSVGDALIGTFNGLAGWAALAPGELIPGNHTKWLEDRVAERMGNMLDFTRPGDEHPMMTMNHILKLPELGIKYFDTRGEYHDVVIEIAPGLVALHGVKTGKHGGAIKEQEGWEGLSVAQGHDHSLQLTAVSKRVFGGHVQHYAISLGAMSLRDLGYSSTQDVDQGFGVITIWPDGSWHPDFALYNPETKTTTWRDWRYSA